MTCLYACTLHIDYDDYNRDNVVAIQNDLNQANDHEHDNKETAEEERHVNQDV